VRFGYGERTLAELVGVVGVPHNPLLWRTMRDDMPEDLARTAENFARLRDRLTAWEPQAVVVVSSDHLRRFFHDNSPAFCIGKADRFSCTYENEMRTFGLEHWEMTGATDLAGWLLGDQELAGSLDFAMSNEWVLDHAFTIPMVYLSPDLQIPIVPIHTNTNIPPIPRAARFVELGRFLAAAIAAFPERARVAVIASGHLATEIGGPRQFLGGGSPDQEFDDAAVAWMAEGDVEGAIAGCSFDRISRAGNVTHQFLNFLVALGAGGGPATFAEGTPSRYANAPFFLWEPAT
jgi:aromatic ring-opening dioxygenase catalytic subunit (LigB family)